MNAIVGKTHVSKLDAGAQRRVAAIASTAVATGIQQSRNGQFLASISESYNLRGVHGSFGIRDGDWRVEQFENTLRARHGRLQNVVFVAQVLDGPEETLRVLDESNRGTHRHRAVEA